MSKIAKLLNPNTKQYWENIYKKNIDQEQIRSDGDHLLKFMPLFEKADAVLDFGGGLGGNLKYISGLTHNTRFILVDHSEVSLDFVKNELLGEKDERGNSFEYHTSLENIPDESIPMLISIQVLEHLTKYRQFMDQLPETAKPIGWKGQPANRLRPAINAATDRKPTRIPATGPQAVPWGFSSHP